ncbi:MULTISPECIES: cell envelope integrity TolA C-terminal domain-containing protein [Enterobacter]|uniref:cell envelope integrity TolA C-terminal domain-containing protein n=1 Tax=Enterobacter TaxID=547 RepID=UPI001593B2D5|nr:MULTISPECIES: cell envelope integrity TolA C-terminal domain-containing protein [Enterobacter]ELE9692966.1 tolA family protein [Enterobacter kobei]MBO4151262.1 tolA family protein [Enterobacter kobei]MCK7110724.1 tolA family protein [Enterobacter kobei]MCK7155040.1 tolA family protein [Enterobacter kobei]MCK7214030.1 tolA family protein [Enterobacter kobei]
MLKWNERQEVSVSETIKKIVMVALVVNMVAGCAPLHPSGCHKTTATGSCSSGRWDDQDEWGAQARAIRAAINDKLDEPQNWKGKKCRLHIEFAQDGTPLNISTSNGNKAYCEAIKSAAQKAKFPAFNNPEVYRDFQKSGFDMRG